MKKATKFAHIGRPKIGVSTSVNLPITRSSTLLFAKAADLYNDDLRLYGRHGSPVSDALEEAFCELENGAGCTLTSSGLAANTLSIQAFTKAGDHILVSDSSYGGTRYFCDNYLSKFGVDIEYFKPNIGKGIAGLIRHNTSCILLESPGSLTLEINDLPAIVEYARKHKITTIVDNTWSAGLVYNPLELGADVATHAATKYYSGHSDVMGGAIVARTKLHANKVRLTAKALGNCVSQDDVYQLLRGFRSVVTRFNQQAETAVQLAKWLAKRPEVQDVRHPALPSHPDHKIWKRDFSGAGCIFSFVLNPCSEKRVLNFLDRLKLFGKGFSFGGYESVIIHCDPQLRRNFDPEFGGPLIRIGCGLEDVDDLQNDLQVSLEKTKFSD
ncbi:MAG: cystathionine beta-lyase [Hyphomonadaceae bacterium]|nr:cystathionine beta-lyase [Hyphomonadaceae bacterium]